MRMARICIVFIFGGLLLTGATLAQATDDEELGASEELSPSSSGRLRWRKPQMMRGKV